MHRLVVSRSILASRFPDREGALLVRTIAQSGLAMIAAVMLCTGCRDSRSATSSTILTLEFVSKQGDDIGFLRMNAGPNADEWEIWNASAARSYDMRLANGHEPNGTLATIINELRAHASNPPAESDVRVVALCQEGDRFSSWIVAQGKSEYEVRESLKQLKSTWRLIQSTPRLPKMYWYREFVEISPENAQVTRTTKPDGP